MKIIIPVRAMSLNDAHEGRHIKTKAFKKYERDVSFLLPTNPLPLKDTEYFVRYTFYIKNYGNSDTGNLEKLITDIIVKKGYIKDDRYIKAMYLEKERVKDIKDERIVLDIVPYEERHKFFPY